MCAFCWLVIACCDDVLLGDVVVVGKLEIFTTSWLLACRCGRLREHDARDVFAAGNVDSVG